jgi:hypothetical protein
MRTGSSSELLLLGCRFTLLATVELVRQTHNPTPTAAKIEVKLSEYKIDMPKTVRRAARLFRSPIVRNPTLLGSCAPLFERRD